MARRNQRRHYNPNVWCGTTPTCPRLPEGQKRQPCTHHSPHPPSITHSELREGQATEEATTTNTAEDKKTPVRAGRPHTLRIAVLSNEFIARRSEVECGVEYGHSDPRSRVCGYRYHSSRPRSHGHSAPTPGAAKRGEVGEAEDNGGGNQRGALLC